jgi:hypothetical protein
MHHEDLEGEEGEGTQQYPSLLAFGGAIILGQENLRIAWVGAWRASRARILDSNFGAPTSSPDKSGKKSGEQRMR